MRVATGTVVAGQVVPDDSEFSDGTHVVVVNRKSLIHDCVTASGG